MGDKQLEFYTGLESLLRYHEGIGLGPVSLNDGIRDFLSLRPPVPVQPFIPPESTGKNTQTHRTIGDETISPGVSEPLPYTLADIEAEVNSCSACDLHKRRVYPLAGKGDKPVRLMIIGDWMSVSGGEAANLNLLFGVQQDQMLFRMLSAMKLPVDDVFITNVIKCGLPEKTQPLAMHVKTCVAYLKKQILVIRPQYICTMGMVAARAVLERSLPLSRLRGKFHDYPLGADEKIPVLTTYHPTYLLQNPEMKKATWTDLQFLAQKMGLL